MKTLLKLTKNATEQRVILSGVSWQQYEGILEVLGDYPGLRLFFIDETLEIFMPSPEHELLKTVIARLLERYAEEMDILLHGYGSTTFRREAKGKGLESDECYCVGELKEIPDFAIEINLTSGGVNKLAIYQGLGIPEVWIWQRDRFTLYDLKNGEVKEIDRSQFMPDLDIDLLVKFVRPLEQPQAVKEFLQAVRSQ
ncbi:hypothetical protein AY599_02205 [Leptolyngbya valderiana BDU 20041]|nr:hypothetical protein AY599_02205 [Leptolyngbya valderiana BDU 20041]PPT05342.1 hypothetical protein CKA32_003133 [Geitlerinema sp. FC II]